MSDATDSQLLRDYAEHGSEAAFAELVRRHVDLVYCAGLRIVREEQLAQDVAQGVFVALARSASRLLDRPALTGWLYSTTRNLAANAVRSDARRRAYEQEAATMNDILSSEPESIWEKILPHLDAAIGTLSEPDRDALLLRYFQHKTAREIAQALGTTEEAAQKRVSRSIERLRQFFAGRGIAVGAGALTAALAIGAAQAAPAALAGTISAAAALAGTTLSAPALMTAAKTIVMTTFQKTLVTAALVAAAGTAVYQARQLSTLRDRLQTSLQDQAALTENMRQLQRERDEAQGRLAALNVNGPSELAKLRAEVARLRGEKGDLPAARVAWLKQKLQQMPDKSIPELDLLSAQAWADAALATDDGARMAFRQLREEAVGKFLALMRIALRNYTAANNGLLPASLLDLKPYFDVPVTDAMLQRYELVQTGQVDPSKTVVRKAAMVDDEYDSDQFMSMNGGGGGEVNKVKSVVDGAIAGFARDNYGQLPADPSQLMPYLKSPIDAATVQKYLDAAEPPPPEALAILPALKAYAEAHNGQWPPKPSDLLPYLDTPEQKAAVNKLEQMSNPHPR